jgi:putative salt-induced outer membrane protein
MMVLTVMPQPFRPILLLSACALLVSGARADLPSDTSGVVVPLAQNSATAPAPASGWQGAGQGGLLLSSGNTSAAAINGKLDIARIDGLWEQGLFLNGFYGRSQGSLSSERAELRYQIDHKISDRNFWFTGVDAVRDLFSGFDYRVTVSGGLGHRFLDSATTRLSATLGVGYEVYEEQTLVHDSAGDLIGRVNGTRVGSMVATVGVKGERKLSATTKLTELLAVASTGNNTSIANDLALQVALGGQLALSVGYGLRANTQPPPGAKKVDQATTINVVYTLR